MEDSPFGKELLERIARIREHTVACPDLSGFELACDRGNITEQELDVVKKQIDHYDRLIKEETAHIEELAARHPAAFDHFLEDSSAQLRRILDRLNRDATTADSFDQEFTRSLLPDVIEGLEDRRSQRAARHSFPWLLRISVDTLRAFGEPRGSSSHPGTDDDGATKSIPTPQIVSEKTLAHYNRQAESFWEGTKDHNVAQNYAALLSNIIADPPFTLLDFGCGPGRDLRYFTSLGHIAIGLDGAQRFVEMARLNSGCEVLHQDFLALDLPRSRFDGVFANAALFHVPSADLPQVLRKLHSALKPGGVLFCSNPRGSNEEGWHGDRYGCYLDLDAWRGYLQAAGFIEICHYYRPEGLPRSQQPWLAMVLRKAG